MKKLLLTSLILIAGMHVARAQILEPIQCFFCGFSFPSSPSFVTFPGGPICPGTSVTITALFQEALSLGNFQWEASNDGSTWLTFYGPFSLQHTMSLLSTTHYRIRMGCWCVNPNYIYSDWVTVTVTPLPTIGTLNAPNPRCVGENLVFPATPTVAHAESQTWQIETGIGTNLYTYFTLPHVVSLADNGRRMRLRAANSCGPQNSNAVPITVIAPPAVYITGPNAICIGQITHVSSSTIEGTWESSHSSIASVNNDGLVTGLSQGAATFTFTANTGCQATTQAVTINSLPTISPVGTLAAHCVGENLMLPTPPTVTGANTHSWEIETGFDTDEYILVQLHPVSLADHGKRIRYRATNICGTQHSNTATITVGDLPTISPISAPVAHCVGSLLTLPGIPIVTSTAPITNRGWQIETGFDTGDYIDFIPSDTISLANHGRRLRYRAANRCSTQFSNTVMIAVDAGPSAFTRLYGERVCRDNTVTVNFSGTGIDASKSTWTNSNPNIGLTGSGAGNLNFTAINPTDSAIFSTITVTPVSASGCSNLGLAQSFSIIVYPSLNAGTIDSMGQAVALNGLADAIGNINDAWGGDGNIQYRWRRNNTIVDGATGATHIPRTNAVGTFIYTREAKDGVCDGWIPCSGEWVLTVIEASITGTDRICIGATTQLSSTIDGTWESSHSGIASVTNEGLVRGLSQGAATFTFTARDINFQATTELVFVSGEMLPEVNNIIAKTDLSGMPYILILPNPTGGDLSFQWYHNGDRIEGATGQFFYPAGGLQVGEYKVYVYRSHLRVCGRFTASYQISLPLIGSLAEWFFLYPNPSDGRFSVVFNKDVICDKTTITMGLFTLQGARITEHQVTGSERFEFNENLNNGIYVLRITTDSNLSETRQIIITN